MKYVWDGGKEELHDLEADQSESSDLLAASAKSGNRLKAMLAKWEREGEAPRVREFRRSPL